jgi:hypothetical protein
MQRYFIPGSHPKFTKLYTYYIYKESDTCDCIQQKVNAIKTGWNDPTQTENTRIAQAVSNNLGGKIVWGNYGTPAPLNYLGRVEGQPGGGGKPLRNKF